MKIPSYKYKFKLMFTKISQVELEISLLCIPANIYFVAVLTRTMKVKNKHISVGLLNYRTIGLRDQWAVGISD